MQDLRPAQEGLAQSSDGASQGEHQAGPGPEAKASSQPVPPAAAAGDAAAAEAMGLQCVALLLPPPAPSPSDALTGEVIAVPRLHSCLGDWSFTALLCFDACGCNRRGECSALIAFDPRRSGAVCFALMQDVREALRL